MRRSSGSDVLNPFDLPYTYLGFVDQKVVELWFRLDDHLLAAHVDDVSVGVDQGALLRDEVSVDLDLSFFYKLLASPPRGHSGSCHDLKVQEGIGCAASRRLGEACTHLGQSLQLVLLAAASTWFVGGPAARGATEGRIWPATCPLAVCLSALEVSLLLSTRLRGFEIGGGVANPALITRDSQRAETQEPVPGQASRTERCGGEHVAKQAAN